jgi:hypothetical protein
MRRTEHIADVIVSSGVGPFFRCDNCKAPLARGGLCKKCKTDQEKQERASRREAKIRLRIPESYRWARLDPGGELERLLVSPAPVRAARQWLADEDAPPFLLIRGKTHQYKSSLAAACARARLEQDRDAYFLFAADMAPISRESNMAQIARHQAAYAALTDRRAMVVINDLARILGSAAVDSGQAAWRRGELCDELHRRCEARARTIITTTLENRIGPCGVCFAGLNADRSRCSACAGTGRNGVPGLVECFGEDIMARLTDERESLMIRLERRG